MKKQESKSFSNIACMFSMQISKVLVLDSYQITTTRYDRNYISFHDRTTLVFVLWTLHLSTEGYKQFRFRRNGNTRWNTLFPFAGSDDSPRMHAGFQTILSQPTLNKFSIKDCNNGFTQACAFPNTIEILSDRTTTDRQDFHSAVLVSK